MEKVDKFTDEDREFLRQVFRREHPDKEPCRWCGGLHERECGRVKRKAFHPNEKLAEVEFWPDWDKSETIWPEEVFDESGE